MSEKPHFTLDIPKADDVWSAWYVELDDKFSDFQSFDPTINSVQLTPSRTLSARQISGQFDDEVAKSWEEDWEDEDVEDT